MAIQPNELNKLQTLKFKTQTLAADIRFLKRCKQRNTFPKFIHIKAPKNNPNAVKATQFAKMFWLNLEIKQKYAKLNHTEKLAYDLHLKITKNLDSFSTNNFIERLHNMESMNQHRLNKKLKVQDRKFKSLCNVTRSPSIDCKNMLNISSRHFSHDEKNLLNKGLKHCLPYQTPPIHDLVVDIESSIKNLGENKKQFVRHACHIQIEKNISGLKASQPRMPADTHTLKNLKRKNCFFLKSDKGNTTVIMDKDEYIERTMNTITNGPYVEIHKNPLNKIVADTKTAINSCKTIINEKLRYTLKIENPMIPKLYALPKIHKPGNKMRPIVSAINSPTYKLAKWLTNEFKALGSDEMYGIKNSKNFIQNIRNLNVLPHEILVSFDVEQLFPSVPIQTALENIAQWLESKQVEATQIKEYVTLTKLCMDTTYFQFNAKWYKQLHGTSMGNPLSCFVANTFLHYFENHCKNTFNYFPRVWLRYVDDIFAVFDTQKYDINDFINRLNEVHASINFTYETEQNGSLPFLDIKVIKNQGHLEFDIYRKNTHTDNYIKSDSHQPHQQKMATFHFLINRLLWVPLNKERYDNELRRIKQIAESHGYNPGIIDKLILNKRRKQNSIHTTLSPIENSSEVKHIALPYYPPLTKGLQKIFKQVDTKVVFTNQNTLKNLLGNPKDKTPRLQQSGIYQIKCSKCDHSYIGQTKRNPTVRFKEHMAHYKNGRFTRSAVAKHIFESDHEITSTDLTLLKATENRKLDAYESLFIHLNRNKILNNEPGIINSKLFHNVDKLNKARNSKHKSSTLGNFPLTVSSNDSSPRNTHVHLGSDVSTPTPLQYKRPP